jgi:hypothetical protein
VCLGREARRVTDRTDDLGGQYGTYAEDVGESGPRCFYRLKPLHWQYLVPDNKVANRARSL